MSRRRSASVRANSSTLRSLACSCVSLSSRSDSDTIQTLAVCPRDYQIVDREARHWFEALNCDVEAVDDIARAQTRGPSQQLGQWIDQGVQEIQQRIRTREMVDDHDSAAGLTY